MSKTFLIDINKYFQRFKDAFIILRIQMENILKLFIIALGKDKYLKNYQPLANLWKYLSMSIKKNLVNWNQFKFVYTLNYFFLAFVQKL